jgi:hypothetical protein
MADVVSDLRLSGSFIEILIHRRLICNGHIEIEHEPSIYEHAISILLPCLAILLKWDQKESDLSVIIYHRVNNRMEPRTYPLNNHMNHVLEFDQILSMPLHKRQCFVRKCLMMPDDPPEQWNHVHLDYHLWLMIIHYWYSKRGLRPVYLYAVVVCLVKFVFLRNDTQFKSIREQLDALASAFSNNQIPQHIDPTMHKKPLKTLNKYKTEINEEPFDTEQTSSCSN